MNAFKRYVRMTLERAGREARLDGARKIEAHHVLLAIAAQTDTAAARISSSSGLDYGALRDALEREYALSLRAVGLSLEAFALPRRENVDADVSGLAGDAVPVTELGTSVRTALERGVSGVPRNPRPEHLLLGILRAEQGTVPRALALAGVDRNKLISSVQHALMKGAA
jgi:ATP-dependent Clp protease ATP-binding subunit ClpA